MGAAVVTTGGGGGAGLVISLRTASETLAALRALRPSTEVSNLEASAPVALRILAMMTSSERLRLVISMRSVLVRRVAASGGKAGRATSAIRTSARGRSFRMRPPEWMLALGSCWVRIIQRG